MEAIEPAAVKAWEAECREFAFVDVREFGIHGESHPLFAVSVPYSAFELRIETVAPNLNVPLVLMDDGRSGVSERCAGLAEKAGYRDVRVMKGGHAAWQEAGYNLFAGVNVPSKVFGEVVLEGMDTPVISATELAAMRAAGQKVLVVDGRPMDEYAKMNIPGSRCCPNGELALRIDALCPDPDTTIVVNCAGRTRSIVGAETLRQLGVRNPVFALKNGTMGWRLDGFTLDAGSIDTLAEASPEALPLLRQRSTSMAESAGIAVMGSGQALSWLEDASRTSYVFDVRSEAEVKAAPVPGAVHAPGGQLVQATDAWVAVRGARIILVDTDGVRAPVVGFWLREMGFETAIFDWRSVGRMQFPSRRGLLADMLPALETVPAAALRNHSPDDVALVDLRPSMAYRKAHIAGSVWSIRPQLEQEAERFRSMDVVLVADDARVAAVAAPALRNVARSVRLLEGSITAWADAGLPIESSPTSPPEEACVDYLFFVHDRHDGNDAAARRYLDWETGLFERLDAGERASLLRNWRN